MSDTLAAVLILPTLAVLVLALECSRMGCTKVFRIATQRRKQNAPSHATVSE